MPSFPVAGATCAARRARLVTVAALVVIVALIPSLAQAADSDDARVEREQVQAQRAQAAGELDAARADHRKVTRALGDLEAWTQAVEARLQDAERAAQTAEADAKAAQVAELGAIARIRRLELDVQETAVDAYMSPATEETATRVPADDLTEQALRDALVDLRSDRSSDLLDELSGARAELTDHRRIAEAAAEEAEEQRTLVAARKAELDEAEEQFRSLAQQVEDRVNHLAGEVASLARQDAALADEIAEHLAEEQAELAELAAAVPTEVVRATAPITSGPVPVTTVGGITVHSSIAAQVEAMLNAARADGVTLTGSGYRDPAEQIALRRQHCGSSSYAIYQAPSSSCSPPTAVPGTSNHERGMAIDFNNCPHGSACFSWLSANAARFGLYNLPSESWHWSVDGS